MPKRLRDLSQDSVRIQSLWKRDQFLHIEKGRVEVGAIDLGWHSAQWILLEVEGGDFVKIQNFWRPDQYLHCEQHRLEAGAIESHWWSAMWKVHRLDGGAFQIENRWKPGLFLHTEPGKIDLGPIEPQWHSARWFLCSSSQSAKSGKSSSCKVKLNVEKWLQPLMEPAPAEQRQIGRDKCIALAIQSGMRLFTGKESTAAAEHVRDFGFAVVESVLSDSVLAIVQRDYAEAIRNAIHSAPNGNRGFLRYSLSQWGPPWELGLSLLDQPEVIDVMRHYFRCRVEGIFVESLHGDFSLPGVEQQPMHIDMHSAKGGNPEMANTLMVYFNMIDHDDLTGPTRFVTGSHKRLSNQSDVKEEKSVLAFAPRGSAIIMDRRTWHGGTRNVSQFARPMLGPHYGGPRSRCKIQRSLDHEHFAKLSPLGQQVCRKILKE